MEEIPRGIQLLYTTAAIGPRFSIHLLKLGIQSSHVKFIVADLSSNCFTKVSSVKRGTWTKHPSLTFAWSNFSRSTLLDGNRVSSASEISVKMMMLADDALSPIDVLFKKAAFLSFFGLILDLTGA